MQEDDFVARDDFEDADQLRIGNDGIFMLTFFSKKFCQRLTLTVFLFLFNSQLIFGFTCIELARNQIYHKKYALSLHLT